MVKSGSTITAVFCIPACCVGYVFHASHSPMSIFATAHGLPWLVGPLFFLAAGGVASVALWQCLREVDDDDWHPGLLGGKSNVLFGCTVGYTAGAVSGECLPWRYLWRAGALCMLVSALGDAMCRYLTKAKGE